MQIQMKSKPIQQDTDENKKGMCNANEDGVEE